MPVTVNGKTLFVNGHRLGHFKVAERACKRMLLLS